MLLLVQISAAAAALVVPSGVALWLLQLSGEGNCLCGALCLFGFNLFDYICLFRCNLNAGVPRGFGFLGYEDQRSTILAVDNANGMKLLQRTLRVDHCKDFRPPNTGKEGEVIQRSSSSKSIHHQQHSKSR